ncbi:polyketide cyclase [Riemerella columbina]|uniref:polyketide cyclase n=1 Tax=Riemerella columbina TaxID=103810 RepID=UPI0026702C7F|nr:polyketide cyclase [Riemerella columbina]WKS95873.1 polyketide cyclase [Riemerella columbina]
MLFVDESKSFRIERTIDYPLEKVYPQFNNFQNMTRWNAYFVENPQLKFEYFIPYEGQGASMNFVEAKRGIGMVFLRYENPNQTLKYEFFNPDSNIPLKIDVKLLPKGNATEVIWLVNTPKMPLLKRYVNLFSADNFEDLVDKSMENLKNLLNNKVDRAEINAKIKYDSLMVEQQEPAVLVGINSTAQNKSKSQLFKNIVKNHHKLLNYINNDLGKREDEFGIPVLITPAKSFNNKEVSYFYGVPLSKREEITDNNFTYQQLPASQLYVMYYKGNYEGRVQSINKLLKKATADSLKTGLLQETFIEPPQENAPVLLKLALPVSH